MTTPHDTLLLIDVMPLLYRGHFAFANRPRLTSSGLNTSAIFIFSSLVSQMLQEEHATHAALAMDTSPTFRHERFPAYKAQRDKMPEDIAASIPMAEEFATAMNLPFLRVPGLEADDVIGTLAALGESHGLRVCLFTPDKDFAQLVTPNITLCRPAKNDAGSERFGVEEVRATWQITEPARMVDLLGLAGDASDNIPGIQGVGEKTAVKLLQEFGTLEGVLAHADDLKGKLAERVRSHAEDARLSRWLAEIRKDAPVPVRLDDLRMRPMDRQAVTAFCHKYELLSLARKLLGDTSSASPEDLPLFAPPPRAAPPPEPAQSAPADASDELPLFAAFHLTSPPSLAKPFPPAKPANAAPAAAEPREPSFQTIASTAHEYVLCDGDAKLDRLLDALGTARAWAFDTETTGLEPWRDRLVGLSFAIQEGRAWYVPVPAESAAAARLLDRFRPLFARGDILKIGQNLKFDLAVLRHAGIEVSGPFSDTMLAHYVCDPTDRHGMDHLARALLRYEPIPITALIGEKGPAQITMDLVPLPQIAEYAAEDADVTLKLHGILRPMVAEARAAEALDRCENALLPVLLDMETEGIRVDASVLHMYSSELAVEIEELEAGILKAAGMTFNIASPKQLGTVLFEHLKLPPAGRTPTGQYETSEEVLSSLQGQHPIIGLILEHRACTKLKSTYVDKLPTCIRAETGRVHTSFNQALTETGRLSSDNPNIQNIPIRTERGRRIREAFVPRDSDHVLLSADYSQVELRVMAALSGDVGMIAAFRNNADIHLETAARVHGIDPEFVTPEMRSQAKMVNFGIIYGISAFGLSQRLGVPRKQAAELIDTYFSMYPAVKHYMDRTVAEAREKGYVATLLGRRRPLRDIASRNGTLRAAAERIAINTPVQGTAADLIKLAMVAVHDDLRTRKLRSRLVLQVHDELVLDVLRSEVDEVRGIVVARMSDALPLAVPLRVDVGFGANWLEAH